MLKNFPRYPIAAEQTPQPQTPEIGQCQLLERPSPQKPVAAKKDSQGALLDTVGTSAPFIEGKNKSIGILGLINWGGGIQLWPSLWT